ncbi:MAG: type VI secretion system baseplate subunit TssF [Alphaproteobacteria bacterium]|nr:type VI secretion system baseplate subunit TssF [Alphaproteobacteria bacterium]
MVKTSLQPFISYYQRELTYLRRASQEFALQYPKVAQRLELGQSETADPHVERLLESFAYLTAGLQRDIDDKFPRLTSALLGVLYPQFTNPIPSMTIARFEIDPNKGRFTSVQTIDKGASVFCRANEGQVCQFYTCYPVDLIPLKVVDAQVVSTDTLNVRIPSTKTPTVLRLRIETLSEPIKSLDIKRLRFYINGDRGIQNKIYELLFTDTAQAYIIPNAAEVNDPRKMTVLPCGSVKPVGFVSEEQVIPSSRASHPAYQLLYEYFNFPQKFMFFDIEDLNLSTSETSFDLVIVLPYELASQKLGIDHNLFSLGCTPLINLFSKTSEPLKIDHKSTSYRLVADYRLEETTEIHSIVEVKAAQQGSSKTQRVDPYFSFNHHASQQDQKLFWYARRDKAAALNLTGTDLYLSFVDFDFNPSELLDKVIYAQLLCTNRNLAQQIPQAAILESDAGIAANIYCVMKPTVPIYPPQEGDTQWRLISQLSLNHISLTAGEDKIEALKEVLYLYASLNQSGSIREIDNLVGLHSKPVTRRFSNEAWQGFAQGTHIELTFDPEGFGEGGVFLFSAVLNYFFKLYASINSFTELAIKTSNQEGIWKQWLPNNGDKFLL